MFTWEGNFYALNLTERLSLEQNGTLLRIGLVYCNSQSDVQTSLSELARILISLCYPDFVTEHPSPEPRSQDKESVAKFSFLPTRLWETMAKETGQHQACLPDSGFRNCKRFLLTPPH